MTRGADTRSAASSPERGDIAIPALGRPGPDEEEWHDADTRQVDGVHALLKVDVGRCAEDDIERTVLTARAVGLITVATSLDGDDRQQNTWRVHERHLRIEQRFEVRRRQACQPVEVLLWPLAVAHESVLADPANRPPTVPDPLGGSFANTVPVGDIATDGSSRSDVR